MSKKQMILPRIDENGKPYISYSQVKLWNDLKSFNMKVEGKLEYILGYFFGDDWPDIGWAAFGRETEDYVCERKCAEVFDDYEREVLETIQPLGVFQKEIKIDFGDFYLLGYIDDASEDFMHLRDYKTCSENSSRQYYEDDYYQLDIYAMWVLQEFGKLPEKLEVCMIEREGNAFRGGRSNLKVKGRVWYHERVTTDKRQQMLRDYIRSTAEEISEHFQIFQKLTGLKKAIPRERV